MENKFKVGEEVLIIDHSSEKYISLVKGKLGRIIKIKTENYYSFPLEVKFYDTIKIFGTSNCESFSKDQIVKATKTAKVLYGKQ